MIDNDLMRQLLRELVAIDSVNSSLVPGARGEATTAGFLRDFLRGQGIAAELQEAAPGRPNVVAQIGPAAAPPSAGQRRHAALAILAHIDTVGAGDMPSPFTPQERDGRLYGRGAIRMMGRVLGLLDALDRKLAQQAPHPRLGCASLHASLISGGQELSSYPAECRLQIERRTLPGESEAEIEAELRGVLEGLEKRDVAFRATARMIASRPPYEISPEAPIAAATASAIRDVTGSVRLSGMAAWTDTALLAPAGIPGVVFGPRGRGLHGAGEYVELESVHDCAEVLCCLIGRLCAG